MQCCINSQLQFQVEGFCWVFVVVAAAVFAVVVVVVA